MIGNHSNGESSFFFFLFFEYNNFWNLSKQRDRMNSKEINDMNVNSFESRNVSFVRIHESQRTSQIINHFLLSVLRNLLCLLIFFSGFCHSILFPICKLNRHSKLCYAVLCYIYSVFLKDDHRIDAMSEVLCGQKYANSHFD